jgi:hypothetical protein
MAIVHGSQQSKEGFPDCAQGLCLNVLTQDINGDLVLHRRSPQLHHAPNLYDFPAGWISTRNYASDETCEDEKHIGDAVLYEPAYHAIVRMENELGILGTDIDSIEPKAMMRVVGHSNTYHLSYHARIAVPTNEITRRMSGVTSRDTPFGPKEFYGVPIVELPELLYNQRELQQVDPATHYPDSCVELPLVDDAIGSIFLAYSGLAGVDLPNRTVNALESGGIQLDLVSVDGTMIL